MEQLFVELTQKEKAEIFGGGIAYKWIYDTQIGRYRQIPINV